MRAAFSEPVQENELVLQYFYCLCMFIQYVCLMRFNGHFNISFLIQHICTTCTLLVPSPLYVLCIKPETGLKMMLLLVSDLRLKDIGVLSVLSPLLPECEAVGYHCTH